MPTSSASSGIEPHAREHPCRFELKLRAASCRRYDSKTTCRLKKLHSYGSLSTRPSHNIHILLDKPAQGWPLNCPHLAKASFGRPRKRFVFEKRILAREMCRVRSVTAVTHVVYAFSRDGDRGLHSVMRAEIRHV